MAKKVVKYVLEFHRSSYIKGTFIMTDEELAIVKEMNGMEIHYGEISGKHSYVTANLLLEEIEILSEDSEEVRIFEKLCPEGAGFNFKSYWFNTDRVKNEAYEASTRTFSH